MRGYFKLLKFLAFPFTKFPHPPLAWFPLSQNGRGFSVIDFICKFDLFDEAQSLGFFTFSFGEKVAESRMRGYFKLLIFLIFLVQSIPSPTTDAVPPLQVGRGFLVN